MIQTIINYPKDSGQGDVLADAFTKVNENFVELNNAITGFTIGAVITNTSDLINDGADGINPFITAQDIPTTYEIEDITGLSSVLANYTSEIGSLQTTTTANSNEIIIINNLITSMLSTINTQNITISQLQADIIALQNA